MDLLRPIYQYINLLEFENAFAGILAILKSEKKFSRNEISEIIEIYFKIPKEQKIRQSLQNKFALKEFFKLQMDTLTLIQKKEILQELNSMDKNDIWSKREHIATCVMLGDIEVARKKLHQLLERSFLYRRIGLIEGLCKQFQDLLNENELFYIEFKCATWRHDTVCLEKLYTKSLANKQKQEIFKESNNPKLFAPEEFKIAEFKQQFAKKFTPNLKKKIVNDLYELLALSSDKQKIMLMCAEYFTKTKRKTVSLRIIEIIKSIGKTNEPFDNVVKSLEESLNKMNENRIFSLEKDEIFDLAEDLFSGSLNDHIKSGKKHNYVLDLSLMDKEAYLIRQGLLSIDEIANKELEKQLQPGIGENQQLEKNFEKTLNNLDKKIKIELHRDLVSALIMLDMTTLALKFCEELIPILTDIGHRISIFYLMALIYFKKEKYDRTIELSDSAITALPLSFIDKIAFLKLIATAFQKKGDIKSSISVKKLIHNLEDKHNEAQD